MDLPLEAMDLNVDLAEINIDRQEGPDVVTISVRVHAPSVAKFDDRDCHLLAQGLLHLETKVAVLHSDHGPRTDAAPDR